MERIEEIKRQEKRIEEINNGPVEAEFFSVKFDPRGEVGVIENIINRLKNQTDAEFDAEVQAETDLEQAIEAETVKPLPIKKA